MTSDDLYPLECECDSSMIHEFASTQARADVADEIVDLIRDRENHRVVEEGRWCERHHCQKSLPRWWRQQFHVKSRCPRRQVVNGFCM